MRGARAVPRLADEGNAAAYRVQSCGFTAVAGRIVIESKRFRVGLHQCADMGTRKFPIGLWHPVGCVAQCLEDLLNQPSAGA